MGRNGAWEFSGKTDPGCVRSNNEDNLLIYDEAGLAAVADGMGGHNSGEVASELAMSTVRNLAGRMLGGDQRILPEGRPGLSARGRQLSYFLETANTLIYEKGRIFQQDAGMGTTAVVVMADDRSFTVAHVGDSRLYLFRNGRLTQLTEDHSLVGDQLRRGLITAEAAARSCLQNILTRALGAEEKVAVDVSEHPALPGDMLLLATDGLSKMVDDSAVAEVMGRRQPPDVIAGQLVDMARKAGGSDNITVICGRLRGAGDQIGLWNRISRFLKKRSP
jgi:protein phosphatase